MMMDVGCSMFFDVVVVGLTLICKIWYDPKLSIPESPSHKYIVMSLLLKIVK